MLGSVGDTSTLAAPVGGWEVGVEEAGVLVGIDGADVFAGVGATGVGSAGVGSTGVASGVVATKVDVAAGVLVGITVGVDVGGITPVPGSGVEVGIGYEVGVDVGGIGAVCASTVATREGRYATTSRLNSRRVNPVTHLFCAPIRLQFRSIICVHS